MGEIEVKLDVLKTCAGSLAQSASSLEGKRSEIESKASNLSLSEVSKAQVKKKLQNLTSTLEQKKTQINALKNALDSIGNQYRTAESEITGVVISKAVYATFDAHNYTGAIAAAGAVAGNLLKVSQIMSKKKKSNVFIDEFTSNYGVKEALSGAGHISTIYGLMSSYKKAASWKDIVKTSKEAYEFVSGAAKTYNNYKKIGNAVGTKTAMAWWAKKITGLKPLGRASAAKNPVTRFVNNLTNKTSPFRAQFDDVVATFKGKNGVKKAATSWASVALSGVTNLFDNMEEQANSNGTMSDARVIAETITETAVDTVITYGANIVVGAAITTALGTVAAPGILVVAASGAVIAGINAGVKALTGKTTTEWVSDTILDTGAAIGKAVSKTAKNVTKSIGNWFNKLSFA